MLNNQKYLETMILFLTLEAKISGLFRKVKVCLVI